MTRWDKSKKNEEEMEGREECVDRGGGGLWVDSLGHKVLDNSGVSNSGQQDSGQTCYTLMYRYSVSKPSCLCLCLLVRYLFVSPTVK